MAIPEDAVARVQDIYLYRSDINAIVPDGIPAADSVALVKKYIGTWIREMLLVKKAEANLTDQHKNVEKQLQNYRNSLITYAYEKELIHQKLDTLVSEADMEKYYKENQRNFELKDNIIRVSYVKVNRSAPDLEKLKTWYKAEDTASVALLEEYCRKYAENYYLDDGTWLLFDDVLKEIPIVTYNKELFLQNNKYVEVNDSSSIYFLNIKGFKIKNSMSPLAFEKDNIRTIIVNKRKLDLIDKMKKDVYKDAELNRAFEIYVN